MPKIKTYKIEIAGDWLEINIYYTEEKDFYTTNMSHQILPKNEYLSPVV